MRARYIDPILHGPNDANWSHDLVDREHPYNPGELQPEWGTGNTKRSENLKKPDYVLRLNDDYPVAVIEAKTLYLHFDDGMQQGEDYAKDLGCKFAYATNGKAINKENGTGIKEYDFLKKQYSERGNFPTIEELKTRLQNDKQFKEKFDLLLEPFEKPINKPPLRYYQRTAINAAIERINQGQKKLLLNLATGTGKTKIAFQIARKVWRYYKDENGNSPKILFITDRDRLLKQAMNNDFEPFGKARHRIIGKKETAYDMYFTLYQSLDVNKEGEDEEKNKQEAELYKLYDPNFFKYIIIDECHRGASTQGGKWRDILDHFKNAVHIGMTATPKRDADSKDTYDYFEEPAYVYSRRQGVEDGFLAPYFLEQIRLDIDETGYIPEPGERSNRTGKLLEQRTYTIEDFDRNLTHKERQKKVAEYIIKFLNTTPNTKFDKTILFCRDQKHASEMRDLLVNESGEGNEYCRRITSNEGEEGKKQLDKFCDPKEKFPVITTTSKLMTTGIDAQTCKVIVLDTFVNSQTELKQIIGRGVRIYESESLKKFYFTIIDFRGSTSEFDDPEWDGEPVPKHYPKKSERKKREPTEPTQRFEVDGEPVEISGKTVKVGDLSQPSGHQLIEITQYIGKAVRTLSGNLSDEFRQIWIDIEKRKKLVSDLKDRGITIDKIREVTKYSQADIFDILNNLGFNQHIKSRHQRAYKVRKDKPFFAIYPEKAREVLHVLLDHYAEYGYQELEGRGVLQLDTFEKFNGPINIVNNIFNGSDNYDKAVHKLVQKIYEN